MEYRNFPLGFHAFAESWAVGTIAAHKQGKFWEFAKLVYDDMKTKNNEKLAGFAKTAGLDVAQFNADLKDPEMLRQVRMDAKAGGFIGVSGTPSMYLNGSKFEARDLEAM